MHDWQRGWFQTGRTADTKEHPSNLTQGWTYVKFFLRLRALPSCNKKEWDTRSSARRLAGCTLEPVCHYSHIPVSHYWCSYPLYSFQTRMQTLQKEPGKSVQLDRSWVASETAWTCLRWRPCRGAPSRAWRSAPASWTTTDVSVPSQDASTECQETVRLPTLSAKMNHHREISSILFSGKLPFRLLTDARRVVMAIVVNHELEMTEIR